MDSNINGVEYGPLAQLLGKWVGIRGLDIAPDADANQDKSAFIDEIIFTASGPAENAEQQQLVSVRYHHQVRKKENGAIFHDQIGHWIFEPTSGQIIHSLTIPRAVVVLAGGQIEQTDDCSVFDVRAEAGSETFGILQSPFMLEKATTKAFHMRLSVSGDKLEYKETTSLHIYGKDFEHTDQSLLQRVVYDLG